ncbi:hypothetical protein A0256_10550 [Mucilaginibacter sp. PAMC 26640]|nr:hypothetical protein A0256_10550 [Mucilaginibacter sp. PAMC 26640]
MNIKYNAPCPVCGHKENSLLYKIGTTAAARHFLVTSGNYSNLDTIEAAIKSLWNSDTAAVVQCNNCRFAFADPFIAGDYQFYNLLPHATADDAGLWKWDQSKTYDTIARLIAGGKQPKLLEIGASTGNFIGPISQLLDKKNLFCLEYSTIGIERIRKMGIAAEAWDFRELHSKKEFANRFDIICLFQVLEHLDRMEDTFATFNSIIKPGGHLFIGVPNSARIAFNERNGALLDLPPNHIGRFNEASFRILGDKFGWQIAEIGVEPTTPLAIMKGIMYYRSLQSAQVPPVKKSLFYKIRLYFQIKSMRVQALLKRKSLGESLWVHYQKPSI